MRVHDKYQNILFMQTNKNKTINRSGQTCTFSWLTPWTRPWKHCFTQDSLMGDRGRKLGSRHMKREITSGRSCDVTCVLTSPSLLTAKAMDDDGYSDDADEQRNDN